jgi:hypothetical protein
MDSQKSQKVAKKYTCDICDYTSCNKYDFTKHLQTDKHKNATNGSKMVVKDSDLSQKVAKKYECLCGKIYKHDSGFYRHKKNCEHSGNSLLNEKEFIFTLLHQNNQLQNQVIELCKDKNGTSINNTNNNINSHNKTFNLQFFLNETCKDAMNIMDFVDSIKLELSDLEKVGEMGYVNGISSIIIKKLQALDISQRPVHCTDKKREVMYIKDDNKWEKDDNENKKMRKFIKKVANKNIRLLQIFKEVHPDCNDSESSCSDQYNKIIVESMGGSGDNDVEKEDKIIRKIAKEVTIDKEG